MKLNRWSYIILIKKFICKPYDKGYDEHVFGRWVRFFVCRLKCTCLFQMIKFLSDTLDYMLMQKY